MNWSWDLVLCEFNIMDKMVVQRWVGEFEDRLRHIVSRSFDWDIVVLLEVDTSLLLGWIIDDTEEFALYTWIGWARDVFAVPPLSITTTSSRDCTATTAGSSRVAICIRIEGRGSTGILPSTTATARRSSRTWSKGWGSSPVSAWSGSVSSEAVWTKNR